MGEEQMEFAKYEHETEMLRKQLVQREWEEHRRMEGERARMQEEELTLRYRQQEEELRRRQEENRLFMQSSYQQAGDSWGRGMSSAQDDDFDFGNYQLQGQRRMGYSRGSSGMGTTNSMAGVADDEERPTTDLRKLLAERGRPKKEESEAGGTDESDLRKLLGRGRGKKL